MAQFNVFLGLGTNIGNRSENLTKAIQLIEQEVGTILKVSPVYQTAAWGVLSQPDFFNQVINIQTDKFPWEVMKLLLKIEQQMGRVRIQKWHERLIDIDILYFDSIILLSENLIIPHPFITQRIFVLKPMNELDSTFIHPILGKTTSQLLAECHDTTAITLY